MQLPLLSAMMPVAMETLPQAKIIEVTQLFWAMATLEFHHEELLSSLSCWATERVEQFTPQQLAGLV
eukprot:symbB.v1.2.001115.t1/scaffold46.1/size430244/6